MIHTVLAGLTTLFAVLSIVTGWRDRRLRMSIPQMYREVRDHGVPQYRSKTLNYWMSLAFFVFLLLGLLF